MGNASSRQNIKDAVLNGAIAQLRRAIVWTGFERLVERVRKTIGYTFPQIDGSSSVQQGGEAPPPPPPSHSGTPESRNSECLTNSPGLGTTQPEPSKLSVPSPESDPPQFVEPNSSAVSPPLELPGTPQPVAPGSSSNLNDGSQVDETVGNITGAMQAGLPQLLVRHTKIHPYGHTTEPRHEPIDRRNYKSHMEKFNATWVASQPLVSDKDDAYASCSTASSVSNSATDNIDFTPNKRALETDEKAMLVQLSKWDSKAVYSKLRLDQSSIRMLEIRRGAPSDDIHVSMTVRRLTEVAKPYEALSYVWGNQDEQKDIFVDNVKVPIGPSLYAALQSLRQPDSERSIWIDAICVNQTSLVERSREVIKMGDIYKIASKVNVFLGASAPSVSSPIESLFQFLNRDAENQSTSGGSNGGLARLQSICDMCHLNAHDVCNGFVEMCLQPWWGRVWILQEFYLASEEPEWYWGRTHASNASLKRDFNLLMDVSWHLFFRKDANASDVTALKSKIGKPIGVFKVQVERTSALISRRLVTHGFDTPRRLYRELLAQAGVKHDYVYGLRSIFDPVFGKVFVPDYNMHKELLFACLAIFLIQFECWGDVLWWYPSRFAAGLGEYPSWLPDFSKRTVPHELDTIPLDLGEEELEPKLLVLNHHLHAEGYVLDKMYGHRHIHESDHHKILAELWQFDHCMNHNHECHDYFVSGAAPEDIWLKVFRDMYVKRDDELLQHFNSAFRGALLQSTMRPEDHFKLPPQVYECVPCWDVLRWCALRTTTPGLVGALGFEADQAKQGCLENIFSSRMDNVFRKAFANFFIGACIFDWDHLYVWLSRFPEAKQWLWYATYWNEIGGPLPEDIDKRTKMIVSTYNRYQSDISKDVLRVSWCYSFYYTYLAYVILLDCDNPHWLKRIIHKLQEASEKLRSIYRSMDTPRLESLASIVPSIKTRSSHLKTVIDLFAGRQLLWTHGGFRGISCPGVEVCSDKKSVVVIADGLSFPLIVRDWDEKAGDGWLAGFAHIRGVNMLERDTEKVVLPEDYKKGEKRIFKFR